MMQPLLSLGADIATDAVVHAVKGGLGLTHALLGTITFGVLTCPESVDEVVSAHFAEHPLIEGKPRLQWIGDHLDEMTWQLVFHTGFCTPAIELFKLRAAILAHQPLPLVMMSGAHRGWFVPVSVRVSTRMTRYDGALLWIEASLTLRECPPPAAMPDMMASQAAVAIEKIDANGWVVQPSTMVMAIPPTRADDVSPLRSAP